MKWWQGTWFLLVCRIASNQASLQSIPLANDDEFEMSTSGGVVALRTDDQGFQWRSKSSLLALDLLRNDEIANWQPETCVQKPKAWQNNAPRQQSDRFEDVADKAGFTHSYRRFLPSRPHCLFDFNIPILQSSDFVRLKGEFCVPEQLPGSAAVADYDNDGYPDIFFTVFDDRSRLYRNNGDGTFNDVTQESRVGPQSHGSGAVWADFDADGDVDLYVTSVGNRRHFLYINQGGRFTEEAIERNCTGSQPDDRLLSGMTPNVGDFNRDGYPDLYITEWILLSKEQNSSSRLFRNMGKIKPGYFEDVTYSAQVDVDQSRKGDLEAAGTFTFCSSMTDFDEDGWPELLVTTDYGDSKMFWNNGDGTFSECTEDCGLTRRVDAMGHAIGDWDGDTHLDWFSTGIQDPEDRCQSLGCTFGTEGNSLYRNANAGNHGRWFLDATDSAGVREGWWGWGTTMFDMNNDKYIDFIMTNGFDSTTTTTDDVYITDPMLLWMNKGPAANLTTVDVARQVGINNTKEGRGLAKFDFDGDGDEDIVVSHLVGKPSLFINLGGNRNQWLRVRVMHRCPGSVFQLCDSLHARVQVTTFDGGKQTQEIGSGAHFMAQNEIEAHFGLGNFFDPVTLYVYWPSHNVFVNYTGVAPNQRLKVIRPDIGKSQTNATIAYSQLNYCPQLHIASASVKSGVGASVWLNQVGQSVGVSLDDPTMAQTVTFDYTVTVDPSTAVNGTNATGTVTLFVTEDTLGGVGEGCSIDPQVTSSRRFDGVSNNQNKTAWGSTSQNLVRDVPEDYADGIASPASQCTASMRYAKLCHFPGQFAGEGSTRPSAREISNKLFHQTQNIPSKRYLSDLLGQWGQFLAHDTDFSSPLPRYEFLSGKSDVWIPISVPKFDIHFDPYGTGNQYLPFIRSTYDRDCTGRLLGTPREQINKITSYIDGSMVYGLSKEIVTKLRTLKDGKMKLQNGGIIPFNTFGLANDNPLGRPPTALLAAGDTRSNVQPGLIALHSLFVREHNRQCDIHLKKFPNATDDQVFEAARTIVIAEIQAITFREFLPALFGRKMPPYKGYNQTANVDAGNSFSTAAFRYGHSQVNTHLLRFDKDWKVIPEGHLPLRDSYFAPERVIHEGGIEPLLRGFVYQPAQEIDTKMIDDMRNVLFPVGRTDGLDLASMNIQRGRDHGLPSYNKVRQYFGLPALKNFSDVTTEQETASILEQLYPTVNDIDLWVGGLAEDIVNGSSVGETFEKILLLNFLRFRDGDRFWYERILSSEEKALVEKNLTLSEIIRLNTDFDDVPENVMFASKHCALAVNHQCVLKPILLPTCSSPTAPATQPSTNANKTSASSLVDQSTIRPTSTSTTTSGSKAAPTTSSSTSSTEAATTHPTTISPCCSERDICSLEKSNLSSTVDILESTQTTLQLKIKKLDIDLSVEKAVCQANKSALMQLQIECAKMKLQLNVTLTQQAKHMGSLEEAVRMLENRSESLQLTLNVTDKRLKHVQITAQQEALTCQSNISKLMLDKLSASEEANKWKQTVLNINKTLINTTFQLRQCQESSTPTATSSFQGFTSNSTTSTPSTLTTTPGFQSHTFNITSTLPATATSMPTTNTVTAEVTRDLSTPCPATDTVSDLQHKLDSEKAKSHALSLEMTKLRTNISFMSKSVATLQEKIEHLKANTSCSELDDNGNQRGQDMSHNKTDDHSETSDDEVTWSDLVHSLPGLVVIAVTGASLLVLFLVILCVCCNAKRQKIFTPGTMEVAMTKLPSTTSEDDYIMY